MLPPRALRLFIQRPFSKGFGDEFFGGLTQQGVTGIARNALTPDLEHDGYGKR